MKEETKIVPMRLPIRLVKLLDKAKPEHRRNRTQQVIYILQKYYQNELPREDGDTSTTP